MIEIQIKAGDFIAWLRRAESELQASARQALGQSVELALRHAKATTLFKDRTGKLRSSIVRGQRGTWSHFLKATAPYAKLVEHGTKAHVIQVKRRKALRFVQSGEIRFAKRVKHPGTKPRPFMQQAAAAGETALHTMLLRAVEHAFR